MDNRPIGIFDSGLGGLTCVKEIMRIMPNESIIYFGDTGRVPYGSRSQETLMKYVNQDIRFLKSFDIKMIIIACGTASSAVLPWRDDTELDIIGVVDPAARAAANATKNGRIGVLGTSATVKYGRYVEKIKELNPSAEIFQKACPMFVPLVENGYIKSDVTRTIAEEYLMELKEAGVDTLILGCTHYPLIKETIGSVMGKEVTLINSGAAAAENAFELLKSADMLSCTQKGEHRYFVSDSSEDFARLGGVFLESPIYGKVEKIDIEKY